MQIVRRILDMCQSVLPIEIQGSASTEIPNMRLDCTKAKNEFSRKPEYSLEDALEETIDFYRKYFEAAD